MSWNGNKINMLRIRMSEDDMKMLDTIIDDLKDNKYDDNSDLGLSLRYWEDINYSSVVRALLHNHYYKVVEKKKIK